MGIFTKIPQDTFSELQLDAGVLLNKFDPAKVAAPADEDIICATTGGINISCVPTYSGFRSQHEGRMAKSCDCHSGRWMGHWRIC